MYVYYFFAAVSLWFGIQSLRGGLRFSSYVRREFSSQLPNFQPFVSVIAPSRGLEAGLLENLRALLQQDYSDYEVLYVFDRDDDPAIALLQTLLDETNHVKVETIIAGPAHDSGQKVHNLREATNHLSNKTEVIAFVDTDARPGKDWLRQLVAPLIDENIGAVTGYRWFVPMRGNFASRLRSVWNASIASALGGNRTKNFCWGGSTAIRRSTFERLNVREQWRGSVSDDFTITHVLHEQKLPIHFAPHCLIPSIGDCSFSELIEFTTRQVKITRVYSPNLWKPLLMGSLLFALVFWGGGLIFIMRLLRGDSVAILATLLAMLFALGALKSLLRWRAISIPLHDQRQHLRRDLWAHLICWPIASTLYLYNAIVAGFSRKIAWRGITYELKSPHEAVIISRI